MLLILDCFLFQDPKVSKNIWAGPAFNVSLLFSDKILSKGKLQQLLIKKRLAPYLQGGQR